MMSPRERSNIDRAEILAGFISESSLYRATHPGVVGVRYGSSQDENLDIFLPSSSTGRAPVHIFNHGGFRYQFGSHAWSFVAAPLTAAGAIVVMPRYSLCPKVGVGEILAQMRTMLCWVWKHIGRYGTMATGYSFQAPRFSRIPGRVAPSGDGTALPNRWSTSSRSNKD
jgi:acetyl esterase/lipase